MRRPELFKMQPIGIYRRRGASPASQARRMTKDVSSSSMNTEPAWHSSEYECDCFHCPPDCPILREGNCPDSD